MFSKCFNMYCFVRFCNVHLVSQSKIRKILTMKLTKIAILAIKGLDDFVKKVAVDQVVSKQTVYRWIADNDDTLTKASILKIIRQETGLTDEQILEKETVNQG